MTYTVCDIFKVPSCIYYCFDIISSLENAKYSILVLLHYILVHFSMVQWWPLLSRIEHPAQIISHPPWLDLVIILSSPVTMAIVFLLRMNVMATMTVETIVMKTIVAVGSVILYPSLYRHVSVLLRTLSECFQLVSRYLVW